MARQNIFGTVFGVDAGMMQIAVFPNLSKRRAGEIVDRIFNFYTSKNVRLVMPATEARQFRKEEFGFACILIWLCQSAATELCWAFVADFANKVFLSAE